TGAIEGARIEQRQELVTPLPESRALKLVGVMRLPDHVPWQLADKGTSSVGIEPRRFLVLLHDTGNGHGLLAQTVQGLIHADPPHGISDIRIQLAAGE